MTPFGEPTAQAWINTGLAVLTVASIFVGQWLARRGKKDETSQQQAAQRIAERSEAFDQLESLAAARLTELNYKDTLIATLRGELISTRQEWEARWSRQMERCRAITDSSTKSILNLIQNPEEKSAARDAVETLDAIEKHRKADHYPHPPGP
jgi:hypothetical protein